MSSYAVSGMISRFVGGACGRWLPKIPVAEG
eukprot:CAMPEP_0167800290 /NCGR_PEP_ID=MMETSP0111_2-20121227/17628_1 /TAXON_ID=91324 /ORGANISM="Lotharella globosa, Strain CCCM811" /LENGTH=30 /DNA_ID= /DNA_START= /DNA_END= /DNA_ORIENTATION=